MTPTRSSFTRRARILLLVSAIPLYSALLPAAPAHAQDVGNARPTSSGWVRAGSDSLYYEEAGAGPAVILVHDGVVHHGVWDEQMPVLSRDHRVIRYDRRGYGASPAPTEPFSNLDDLQHLMEHLAVEAACLVAGSAGGPMAIDFTLEHPDEVDCLILVGAVVSGFPYTPHFLSRGGHAPEGLPIRELHLWYVMEDPYTIDPRNRETKARVRELIERYPTDGTQGSLRVRPEVPALGRLDRIAVPTLVLVGESDIPDVHAHAGAIAAGIPGAERDIILQAAHLPSIEQPEAFNRRVLEFLGRVFR